MGWLQIMVATMIIKDAAYYKAYREKKKAKMDEWLEDIEKRARKQKENPPPFVFTAEELAKKSSLEDIDRKIKKRCQAGMDGGACPNFGVEARIGENKVYLCSMHLSMGKLVEA